MSEKENNNESERREYFRIDDSVRLSYRQVDKKDLPTDQDELEYRASGGLTVMTRLSGISQQLTTALHRIEQRDPDVADYLKALDQKLEIVAQTFLANESDLVEQTDHEVNLSAGGMAINLPDPIEVGACLEIKLLLFPSYTGILTYGEVVSCARVKSDYRVRIDFTHIKDSNRDALIRHILRRQGELLRRQREERDLEE